MHGRRRFAETLCPTVRLHKCCCKLVAPRRVHVLVYALALVLFSVCSSAVVVSLVWWSWGGAHPVLIVALYIIVAICAASSCIGIMLWKRWLGWEVSEPDEWGSRWTVGRGGGAGGAIIIIGTDDEDDSSREERPLIRLPGTTEIPQHHRGAQTTYDDAEEAEEDEEYCYNCMLEECAASVGIVLIVAAALAGLGVGVEVAKAWHSALVLSPALDPTTSSAARNLTVAQLASANPDTALRAAIFVSWHGDLLVPASDLRARVCNSASGDCACVLPLLPLQRNTSAIEAPVWLTCNCGWSLAPHCPGWPTEALPWANTPDEQWALRLNRGPAVENMWSQGKHDADTSKNYGAPFSFCRRPLISVSHPIGVKLNLARQAIATAADTSHGVVTVPTAVDLVLLEWVDSPAAAVAAFWAQGESKLMRSTVLLAFAMFAVMTTRRQRCVYECVTPTLLEACRRRLPARRGSRTNYRHRSDTDDFSRGDTVYLAQDASAQVAELPMRPSQVIVDILGGGTRVVLARPVVVPSTCAVASVHDPEARLNDRSTVMAAASGGGQRRQPWGLDGGAEVAEGVVLAVLPLPRFLPGSPRVALETTSAQP
jgi:hypothetical protein